MKIVQNESGLSVLNDDGSLLDMQLLGIEIYIGVDGTTARLVVPVDEIEVVVPDTGVTTIKKS